MKAKYKYTGHYPTELDGIGEIQPGDIVEFDKEQEKKYQNSMFTKIEEKPKKGGKK